MKRDKTIVWEILDEDETHLMTVRYCPIIKEYTFEDARNPADSFFGNWHDAAKIAALLIMLKAITKECAEDALAAWSKEQTDLL